MVLLYYQIGGSNIHLLLFKKPPTLSPGLLIEPMLITIKVVKAITVLSMKGKINENNSLL